MKLRGNTYYCEWCAIKFEKVVGKWTSTVEGNKGKSNVTNTCLCPKCNRKVSQKVKQ